MMGERNTFFFDSTPDLEGMRARHGVGPNEVVFHDSVSFLLCTAVVASSREAAARARKVLRGLGRRTRVRADGWIDEGAAAGNPALKHYDALSEPCRLYTTDASFTGITSGEPGYEPVPVSSRAFVARLATTLGGLAPSDIKGLSPQDIDAKVKARGALTRAFLRRKRAPVT
jgi:hypothetical protein